MLIVINRYIMLNILEFIILAFSPIVNFIQWLITVYNSDFDDSIKTSGKMGTNRSISETKKKYVASQQNWNCGECRQKLSAWFEVDHVVRLEHGGGNYVDNLIALCRECHGRKTAMENM